VWKRVLLPAGLLVLLYTFVSRGNDFRETYRYSLQGIGLAPVFVVAVRYPTFGPFRLLNLRPMRFLGVISYSLYLVHHIVIEAIGLRPGAAGVVRGLFALAISVGLAWSVYELVEKPMAGVRRRLGGPKARAVAAPTQSVPAVVGARAL
jgi:peptidoglycan/LPS O-acetylase OafA/YrhL